MPRKGEPKYAVDPQVVIEIAKSEYGANLLGQGEGLLRSALAAPFHTFGSRELFPNAWDKAAVLLRSIVKNHTFEDANKRIGVKVTLRFLDTQGYRLPSEELTTLKLLALLLASDVEFGDEEMELLKKWFKDHLKPKPKPYIP